MQKERTFRLVDRMILADSFWKRLKGLLGTEALPEDTGLLLKPCRQIHTWWMKYPIDVLYLDSQGNVLHIDPEVPPNKWKKPVTDAAMVLEVNAGLCRKKNVEIGQKIDFLMRKEGKA